MKRSLLRKYAHLIAVIGANVQKDQPVVINASVDQYAFIDLLMEECYLAGASAVRVEWGRDQHTLMHYKYQTLERLSTVTEEKKAKLQSYLDDIPCMIHIVSDDPSGLAGIDREKMMKARQAAYPIVKPYNDAMENRYQWVIAAVPSRAWAHKVFPDLSVAKAVEKLWHAIFATCHITETNDPVEAWHQHNNNFSAHCRWLNAQHFDALSYKSSNGTDFHVSLIPSGVWCGGSEATIGGITFQPNMPTEEIFTTPMSGKAEGRLVSTKPLSYQGQIIDGFSITFHGGRATEWHADVGQDLLSSIIQMDDGAARIGELALVPDSSPISQSGILFYETLFDENASCHVAIGRGFNDCISDYQRLSDDECKALGVNDSMVHVDFMIGAPDLCITGWKSGVATPIFINGEWAPETI